MTIIPADDLQPGDIVEYQGVLHRITRVERGGGRAWPVALGDDGWGIALSHAPIVVHDTIR